MLTVRPEIRKNPSDGRNQHESHGDKHACMQIRSLVSGMPRQVRDNARLVVLQAWFDDSGKEGIAQSPVYLLAGYSARVKVWESFADQWQAELARKPRLAYLHAKDAYNFKKEFGYQSGWAQQYGHMNRAARDERLLRFAGIIVRHLKNVGHGMVWLLRHEDYGHFSNILAANPRVTDAERQILKNPYYFSFQKIIGDMIKMQAGKATRERIEILFDDGMDDRERLAVAFNQFVEMLSFEPRIYRDLLINKTAEFRDDKDNPPLQAADLLAWHIRRFCYKAARKQKHDDPVFNRLREMEILHDKYDENDWLRILRLIRDHELVVQRGRIMRMRLES